VQHLMGRQPILNGLEEIVGYELLFRSPRSLTAASFDSHVQATAQVIVDVLSSFGIREVLGEYRGYINVDAEMLLSDTIELLPHDVISLELLEHVEITPDLMHVASSSRIKVFCWPWTTIAMARSTSRSIRGWRISSSLTCSRRRWRSCIARWIVSSAIR